MTRTTYLKMFAWLAVLSVVIGGDAFAQATKPSLVTQQMRLSDGTGSYINLRAGISGIASDNIPYFLDQAPAPDATKGYSLWLTGANHIVTSDPFVAGATTNQFWLERVKANGGGLEWVDPNALVLANNGLTMDYVTTPGSPTVQMGGPLIKATSVDQAGFNLSFVNSSAVTPTTFTMGNGTNVFNIAIDPSATGNININNMQADNTATDFLVLDATKNVKTRPLSSLVVADNGITINPVGGFVELGGIATNTNPLLVNRFVTLGGNNLTFDGSGNFNIGDGTGVQNITLDPSATGSTNLKNLATDPTPAATDRFVMMAAGNDKAFTRDLQSLVNANNGLVVDNTVTPGTSTVQLGAPATGGANLLVNRFVTLAGQTLNFDGAGNFNVGDGTNTQNITLDPGAAGSTNLKNLATDPTPAANDRFVMMAAGNDKTFTRDLSTIVNANNGLVVDNTVTPGTSTVQLGSPASGGAPILVDRYVSLGSASLALNFEGDGIYNIGTTGNIAFNVKTGTSDMTLQGANLASPAAATPAASDFSNFAYVNSTTNVVHTITTANMARNDNPTDFVAIDPATGNIVKSISPTAGIYRGHTAWSGTPGTGYKQTITLLPTQTIVAGATVTATNENHDGEGTVAIQVTSVNPGAGGSFDVEASDILSSNSFINWVVMNP